MNIKAEIEAIGLNADTSVVIGAGILEALGIRKCTDIDLVVSERTFSDLFATNKFELGENFGVKVLRNDIFDIRTIWGVLGKPYDLEELKKESVLIDDVRYINLDFSLKVKESWIKNDKAPRQKDFRDIELIKKYRKAGLKIKV